MKNKALYSLKQVILFFGPFVLLTGAILMMTLWLFNTVIASSSLYTMLLNAPADSSDTNYQVISDDELERLKENNKSMGIDFPVIAYGEKWATLTIEDAGIRDLPVYNGDSYEMLLKGAGHYLNSRFPGQNGKTVLAAHVKMYFQKLETLKPGSEVILDTKYGKNVYKITDTLIFNENDASAIAPDDGKDILMCYTCYPYKSVKRRTERFAIICEKVSGQDYTTSGKDQ